ncbi:MAG: TaqI-like C-terminal specificity domain-containing protein [Bacilli bacterium]
MESNELLHFIEESKSILCKRFFADSGIEFKDIYPTLFDEIKYDNVNLDSKLDLSDYLGLMYEQSIPTKVKKDLGQFYTRNSNMIELMLSRIDILSGKILEPSCGSGLFLVKIQESIINVMKSQNSPEEILNYLTKNILANDINDVALQIAEINLITNAYSLILEAVKMNPKFKMQRYILKNMDFLSKNQFKDISIVIGNPPFVTMYGKRSRNMNEEKRKFFNTFDFVQDKTGNNKFNISMFFIENGLKSLVENGQLIFILDISFFETAYIDLRKYLLENYCVDFICTGLSEFEGVASGQLIISIKNKSSNSLIEWLDIQENSINFINQNEWMNDHPKYRFRKPFKQYEEEIINKIKKHPSLEYFFPNKALRTCCALTGKTNEFIVSSKDDYPIVYPYIEGSKGLEKKFGKLKSLRLIKYDYDLQIKLSNEFKIELEALGVKNKKRVTLGDKDAYDSPKIFIRQSANELIATYTEEPYAANNSIYILTNKKTSDIDKNLLKFTCGIINSDLMTFYALVTKIIRVEKGKTPQIKTSDLKDIRIPLCINDEKFIILIDELINDPDNKIKLEEMNNRVYEYFDISKKEIEYISKYLNQ